MMQVETVCFSTCILILRFYWREIVQDDYIKWYHTKQIQSISKKTQQL